MGNFYPNSVTVRTVRWHRGRDGSFLSRAAAGLVVAVGLSSLFCFGKTQVSSGRSQDFKDERKRQRPMNDLGNLPTDGLQICLLA